jgi:hypothetical protein
VSTRVFTDAERRARLAIRHRLAAGTQVDDVASITDDLVGLHSSDPGSVYLSATARMANPRIEAVADALFVDHTVVRHHAMRRTLWVFTPKTARIAHSAATERVAASERDKFEKLLGDAGVADPGSWIAASRSEVLAELELREQATTRVLGKALPHLRLPVPVPAGKNTTVEQPALNRLLLVLGLEGIIARGEQTGTWANSEYAWAPMGRWIPEGIGGLETDAARGELADRWLRVFGPAPRSDLQWWTGWPAGTTKRALEGAGAEAEDVELEDGTPAFVAADDNESTDDPGPWVALLPGLDPTTMGWKTRDWYLEGAMVPELFDRNGNAGPTVWVDGRIVGGWVQRPDGEIAIELLTDVGAESCRAIDARAEALAGLIGDVRFKVRFPAPMQKRLYG